MRFQEILFLAAQGAGALAAHIASILMEGSGYILLEDGTSSIGLE